MVQKQTIEQRADEIYDELMESLDASELKLANIGSLEEKYRGESPIERAARLEFYGSVFEEAERLLALRKLGQQNAVHAFLNEQRTKAMKQETSEKSQEVERAEDQLDSLDQ